MLRIDQTFRIKQRGLVVTVFYELESKDETYKVGDLLTDTLGQTFKLVGIEHIRRNCFGPSPEPEGGWPIGLCVRAVNPTPEDATPTGAFRKPIVADGTYLSE